MTKEFEAKQEATGKTESEPKVNPQAVSHAMLQGAVPLNDNELKSVRALIAYTAHNQKAAEETVQAVLETGFGVDHYTKLQQKDYEEVIRFLVDLRLNELRN